MSPQPAQRISMGRTAGNSEARFRNSGDTIANGEIQVKIQVTRTNGKLVTGTRSQ